ncbi:unnamed protein product [Adineta steineri]|uniref:Peptidase S8/S53 domain-containing protein n=1 Tax=Adineta steineri TaxID=433720 RepID=A0A818RFP2_9BILA|nr:unnamed protein product [Adineta steineri]CAF3656126.1 unnamed protein product [Adineta steineri]
MGYTGRGVVVSIVDDGLETDHPDLKDNYDPQASHDVNDNDRDPTPRYESTNENKGPDDTGTVVDGPGRLTRKALQQGAVQGRHGKGSIFVWASGNGGLKGDSCACDGYVNSIYTVAVSAITEKGEKPWYLEECSATLASVYSSGSSGERSISTTDLNHGCTDSHTGTSAAAPLAAGIYALILEANPALTWRDVMHITVLTARPNAISANTDRIRNAAGFYGKCQL